MAEETAHLAPHGVPSNPLPRGLSSNKLQDLATENHGYGATHTSGSNLNIPQGIQKIFLKALIKLQYVQVWTMVGQFCLG